jgi:predicted Zn-dependent protease
MKLLTKIYWLPIFVFFFVGKSIAKEIEIPGFLPSYYSPAFQIKGQSLDLVQHANTNNVEQWSYASKDKSIRLLVENIQCERSKCQALYNNIIGYLNNEISEKDGEFVDITEREVNATIIEKDIETSVFAYMIPSSIHIWNYSSKKSSTSVQSAKKFTTIKSKANKHRYIKSLSAGNVAMGFWGPSIHEYALELLRENKKEKAEKVFKDLLKTSPFNYKVHIAFMQITDKPEAALSSAKIVLKNAEDNDLIEKASKHLNTSKKQASSFPFLQGSEKGLQVVLVPIEPCNIMYLAEASKIYTGITGIGVKILRLPEKFSFVNPDRIPYQRNVQEILVKLTKDNIDFTGWTKEQYIQKLQKSVASEDALSQYHAKDLINKINLESGQFFVNPYLIKFSEILRKYRSNDYRTMYVGVTEENIYSGDNNYVFSLGRTDKPFRASILSYNMMLAKTLSEEYESRQRLAERIAKELVPASLKQLGIPRSTDPTCPYSYSSGVTRLDQKTLKLSEQVEIAIDKINISSNEVKAGT